MSQIKPKECQNVEFKSSWNDKYLEWICGFANAQGAVMYFGVNDDHEVVGLKNTKKLLEDIPNKVVNYLGIVVDVNNDGSFSFIHASTSEGVKVSKSTDGYYARRYVGARRVM